MIIWINGAFGAGKTTIAELLSQRIKSSFLYDPENIGGFLNRNLPDSIQKNDFQDYIEWRQWNVQILKKLHDEYAGDIIVPMTLYKKESFTEIIGELRREKYPIQHFQLEVSKEKVAERLLQRNDGSYEWGMERVDEIIAAYKKFPLEEKINNENRSAEEVAAEILTRLEIN